MTGSTPTAPLVLTADRRLSDELERVCAAVGLEPVTVEAPVDARPHWSRAVLVLVGDDQAAELVGAGFPDRSGIVVVTRTARLETWQRGVELRASAVVEVPAERSRLSELLADRSRTGDATTTKIVGLCGARGGVGTSTTAATLGLTAVGMGRAVTLVDADPDSSGLDLLLGCESADGLRWPDVAAVDGRVPADALRAALPSAAGMPVLTWAPDGSRTLEADTLTTIVTSASRGCDLVLVDLGRRIDGAGDGLLAHLGTVLVVCGSDLLSAAGLTRVAGRLRPRCADLRVVIRHNRAAGAEAAELGRAVGLRVAAVTEHSGRVDRAIDDGLGPPIGRRERRVLRRLVDDLVHPPPVAMAG